jgi:CobQ-like glutamine amidotransferase family enzyme
MAGEVRAVLSIVNLLPDLLGTYGDAGNGLVLAQRARARGEEALLTSVGLNDEMPDADIYLLGGGEDGPQRLACDVLRASSFTSRVRDGACVLAVCAGLQMLGSTFSVEGDEQYEGLGLCDALSVRGQRRSVGELRVRVGDRLLVGFENHGGRTTLGTELEPLGRVEFGQGNDGQFDGFRAPRLWATYAHGPVLAQNPWFADEILSTLLGYSLEPLTSVADLLYEERSRSVTRS